MMKSLLKLFTLCLLLFGSGVQTAVAAGAVFTSESKVIAADGKKEDYFGYSVAIDGTRMAVGASNADIGGIEDQGAVYLYDFDGSQWQETAKLTAADGVEKDYFGHSVALAGDRVVVGAVYAGIGRQGATYVFDLKGGNWQQSQKLTADDGAAWDNFGKSLALDGNRLVVGTGGFSVGATNTQGAAYVFDLTGGSWQQSQKLTAADGAEKDYFGHSVALDGNRVVVGAWEADIGGNEDQGAAYVFNFNGSSWQQRQKLTVADGAKDDSFGNSLALDGDRLVVGASAANIGGNIWQGAAYVFDLKGGSWQQRQKLTAADGARDDLFGATLALDGNRLVVGAHRADIDGKQFQGAAYVFDLKGGSWQQRQKLTAADGAEDDYFGTSLALDGNRMVVGAYWADIGSNYEQGAVYVYMDEAQKTLSVVVSGLAVGGEVDLDINGTSSTVKNGKTDTSVNMGESYSVGINQQPAGGSCSLSSNSSGAMGGSDVVVLVECEQDSYTVGGTVTLPFTTGTPAVSVTLQNNGGDDVTLTTSGAFTFATSQVNFSNYAVTVASSNPTMTCNVSDGNGQVLSENVITVDVVCEGHSPIYGRVENFFDGGTMTVQSDVPDDSSPQLTETITITSGGYFEFPTALFDGTSFVLNITQQPALQHCEFHGSTRTTGVIDTGTATGLPNYIEPVIHCDGTGYSIDVNVTGLTGAERVTLRRKTEVKEFLNGNGYFDTVLADGSAYSVSIEKQPEGKTCKLANESGTISGASAKVSVTCTATSQLNLNVKVSGLGAGKTVVVSDSVSGDNKSFSANATATLTSQDSGTGYNVVVTTQPSGQHCKVIDGSGTLNASTEIAVKCYDGTFKTFYVTGNVVGLASGQNVTLQNNGGDDLPISGNGGFVFATALFNHDKYNVTVSKQPTKQTCTVSNGSGEILGKTVNDIVVTCKANNAGDVVTVGGTLSGLNGGEVVIGNSTIDALKLTADGNFTFANSLLKGSSYFVYVKKQPAGQVCTVSNGSGTANANVSNVAVSCQKAPTAFSVGGTVSGLGSGKNVVLQNNGGDDVTMSTNGTFAFATPVAVGQPYAVTVKTQPTGQTCTVGNASGNIGSSNVNNVAVSCSDNAVEPPVPVDPSAPQSVPSLSEKALLLLMLVLATATAWFIRQRRLV